MMTAGNTHQAAAPLLGGGATGERIRTKDWSGTPLGPIEEWPPGLKSAVEIMLGASSPMAVCWGPDLILLYNDAWSALIGDRHPRALGRPVREVFPEAWDAVGPLLAGVMAGHGAAEARDQRLLLDRGGRIEETWFDYNFTPVPSDDGSIGGILNIVAETTDRVRAERALRQAERQYRELVQYAPAAIYEIDFRQRRFISVNDAMSHMIGYTREELLALDPFSLLDERGQALFRSRIQQWLSGHEPDRNVEFRIRTKYGYTIDLMLDVTFTTDRNGEPLGAAVVAHDVTERKRREHRIRRYNSVLRAINHIFEQAIQAETEDALGNAFLDAAMEVTGSQFGFVDEIGPDGLLHDVAISETGWDQCQVIGPTGHRRPPGDFLLHGLYGRVIDDGRSFFTNDPSSHPDSIGLPDGHPPLTSFLGVPLIRDGKTIGMLAVANRDGGYSLEQQEDLEALAPAVVQALLRKRTEEALRESTERAGWLARFPEENPNPVLRVSADGVTMYRNPAASTNASWQCEVGQPLPHRVLRRLVGKAIAEGQALEQDVDLNGKSFSVAVSPIKGKDYANIYARDITERVRTEEALRQSEARRKVAEAVEVERRRFNDMLDLLPMYVVLLAPDYHVPFANRFFRERFGESSDQHCYEHLFGRTTPCDLCETRKVFATNEPDHREWTGPDGRLYDVYDFPFTDTDGSPLIMEMGIDITEQARAQEALIRTERLAIMGRMTASLAHEVNNPIQSVVGCLGLAQELLNEGEDPTQFIEVALEESERAARIVHRMRGLGRSEEPYREHAAVDELIEKVLILTQNQAQNQHVEVAWDVEEELPHVPIVRDRIQQVFLNLVLNAIDAMPEGGKLHIRAAATERPPGVQVSFADTGVGIAPEDVTRMFEAFHSTKQLGLGLGLYVSRNIVQEHDGWIDVQSEVGGGSTFTVWLPAGQA